MTAPGPLPAGDPPPAHLDPNYRPPAAGAPAAAPPPPPAPGPDAAPPPPPIVEPQTGRPTTTPPPSADANFGRGSGVDLAPVSQDMADVRAAARSGELRIDAEAADALLKDLADIKDRVSQLTADATELDVPLQLGDNWVGRAMSQRLHAVAQGQDSAALRVFKQFAMVVEDYEQAVRRAAERYVAIEDDVQSDAQQAARRLDVIDGRSS